MQQAGVRDIGEVHPRRASLSFREASMAFLIERSRNDHLRVLNIGHREAPAWLAEILKWNQLHGACGGSPVPTECDGQDSESKYTMYTGLSMLGM
jgi:hypothetical protein